MLEVAITIALLSIVVVAVLGTLVRATETSNYALQRSQSLDQLRLMANEVTKDLRQATEATSINYDAITVRTYVDGTLSSVTWRVVAEGTGLHRVERLVGSSPQATYVVALTAPQVFSFAGVPLSNPGAVSQVHIELYTQPDDRHPAVGIETDVEMRNAT